MLTVRTLFYQIYMMVKDCTRNKRNWRLSRRVTASFVKACNKRCGQAWKVRTYGIRDADLVVLPVLMHRNHWICIALTNMKVLASTLLGKDGIQAVLTEAQDGSELLRLLFFDALVDYTTGQTRAVISYVHERASGG